MVFVLALLAFLVPIIVVTEMQDAVALPKLVTTAALTGVALIWGAAIFASDRWQPRRWPISLWLTILAFLAANVLAFVFATDWRASLMGEPARYQGLATTVLYVLLFAGAAMAVSSTRDLRWLLLGLFAGGFGASVYALIQKAGLDWIDWSGASTARSFGTLGQANVLGAYLVVALSATAYLALTASRESIQYRLVTLAIVSAGALGTCALFVTRMDGLSQIFAIFVGLLVLAVILALFWALVSLAEMREQLLDIAVPSGLAGGMIVIFSALLFTLSRSAFLAVGVVFLVWGVAVLRWYQPALASAWSTLVESISGSSGGTRQQRRQQQREKEDAEESTAAERSNRRWVIGIGAAMLVPLVLAFIVAFFVGLPQGRVAVLSDENSAPLDSRLTLWSMSLDMIADEPLFGFGQDAFSIKFPEYRDRPDMAGIITHDIDPESSHNFFLDLASGTGLLGLGAFLALLGVLLWHAARRALGTEDASLRLAFVALGAGALGYLAAIFFGFSESMTSWSLWLLLGAMAGLIARPSEQPAELPPEEMEEVASGGTLATAFAAVALTLCGAALLGWAATLTAADLAAAQSRDARILGDYEDAARLAGRAATLNPLQRDYLIQEGQAYQRVADTSGSASTDILALEPAIEAYEAALSRFEPEAGVALALAIARNDLALAEGVALDERLVELEEGLKRAAALDPFNKRLRQSITQLFEEADLPELAQEQRVVLFCWNNPCE